ncbi:contractile injection system tape measure protein [Streptomyces justiciae]|uniref:Contractile injection system tape measure protein n=1 Tax=Streptomyces justiciae TaxID=2780140 RepID=A0ABU3M2H0_9ACTN|nr:contractile injection system tape measure protein [Streptomyces justiciae]MDT7844923.1 contractile injection system tape measure protein [Streptomyces justiciae]
MTDIVVDRLSIRGPAGRRLAAIAARSLPAALEEALGDLEDVELGRLHVRIELDVRGYDDRTVAVLWADAVRRSAIEAGAGIAVRRKPRPEPDGDGRSRAADGSGEPPVRPETARAPGGEGGAASDDGVVEEAVSAALSWLGAGAPPSAVPVAVLRAAEPGVARAVLERLGPAAGGSLVARFEDLRRPGTPAPARPSTPAGGPDAEASAGAPAPSPRADDRAAGRPSHTASAPPGPDATAPDLSMSLALSAEPLRALAALASAPGTTVGLRHVTRVAGLLLLYPWLRDLCREWVTGAGGSDAEGSDPVVVDLRRRALARLADPADPALVDDPLVLLLAGAPLAGEPRPLEADEGPDAATEAAAERVLRGFAALLPGFGGSSPEFVRSAWLRRDGLIEAEGPVVRIAARALPLDLLLPSLPYPLGLVRLPWTPPMALAWHR